MSARFSTSLLGTTVLVPSHASLLDHSCLASGNTLLQSGALARSAWRAERHAQSFTWPGTAQHSCGPAPLAVSDSPHAPLRHRLYSNAPPLRVLIRPVLTSGTSLAVASRLFTPVQLLVLAHWDAPLAGLGLLVLTSRECTVSSLSTPTPTHAAA